MNAPRLSVVTTSRPAPEVIVIALFKLMGWAIATVFVFQARPDEFEAVLMGAPAMLMLGFEIAYGLVRWRAAPGAPIPVGTQRPALTVGTYLGLVAVAWLAVHGGAELLAAIGDAPVATIRDPYDAKLVRATSGYLRVCRTLLVPGGLLWLVHTLLDALGGRSSASYSAALRLAVLPAWLVMVLGVIDAARWLFGAKLWLPLPALDAASCSLVVSELALWLRRRAAHDAAPASDRESATAS